MSEQSRSRWAISFAVASAVSALTVWVVPIYQARTSGELRTVFMTLDGEPWWLAIPLLVLVVFPLVVALQARALGPEPRVWARVLLAFEILLYGACALLGMLMIALEGALFSMSGGTMRADNLLVDAAAWLTGLYWTAVGIAATVLVFKRRW